ncbi:MAG: LysR family transcriptional regulator [Burkholderiaceae bacterium]|nr:LysR family transcriptional regulator [Burkholderiaceae bacterium]
MASLNFHHLRYFWAIAHERSLTKAAAKLHISPSALSIQLRHLEDRLGQPLFDRQGKQLTLTEAGRIALDHADTIFKAGDELVNTLKGRPLGAQPVLRVGSSATLSRNFQMEFLRPLLESAEAHLVLVSGSVRELLLQLQDHTLDVVLSNHAVPRERGAPWQSHLIAEQSVSLVGRRPRGAKRAFRFPQDLHGQAIVLPSESSVVRTEFDLLLDSAGVRPRILAEVDDMALMRVLARESGALTLVPPVVVQDELRSGLLVERYSIPQLQESFYAITASRRYPSVVLRKLLKIHQRG